MSRCRRQGWHLPEQSKGTPLERFRYQVPNFQDLQISTRGRVQPLTNCPPCTLAAPPASIGLTNGYETQTIAVSASGMVSTPGY